MMFEKMWAVAERPGEHRLAAMAAAAEKLKHGICCGAGSLLGKDPCGVSSAVIKWQDVLFEELELCWLRTRLEFLVK